MRKFNYSTREIGDVGIFDLRGTPTFETVQEVAWKIQRSIRRHHYHQIILNFKDSGELDTIALRHLLTVCIRPKRCVLYGSRAELGSFLEENCFSEKVNICENEVEVAESYGTFLFDKDPTKRYADPMSKTIQESLGYQLEARRKHRMHVAIPVELTLASEEKGRVITRAIATNISEGGLFVEYLDLAEAEKASDMGEIVGNLVGIRLLECANFSEEYNISGIVKRKERSGGQFGLGIEFVENKV